jgi:hypothetical protein
MTMPITAELRTDSRLKNQYESIGQVSTEATV